MRNIVLALVISIFFLTGCNNENSKRAIQELAKNTKEKYFSPTQDGIFDLDINSDDNQLKLELATTSAEAAKDFLSQAENLDISFTLNVRVLPDKSVGEKEYGLINVSVADLRNESRYTSGMATQALLGTPVKLLDDNKWYRVQLPNTYYGWIPKAQLTRMTKAEYNEWIAAPKIIYTALSGYSYSQASSYHPVVSDLVAGSVLKLDGYLGNYYKVLYPDGRTAYVSRSEASEYTNWLASREPSGESYVAMAKTMLGFPYFWGGTSTKGMDCSGMVSTVLNMHGITIFRDASQQAHTGEAVDISQGYDSLQVGDLMFFGKKEELNKAESIRHVGFYIGSNQFIHSASSVHISSLNPEDENYDELNTKEFIRASRITNQKIGSTGLWKTADLAIYKPQE